MSEASAYAVDSDEDGWHRRADAGGHPTNNDHKPPQTQIEQHPSLPKDTEGHSAATWASADLRPGTSTPRPPRKGRTAPPQYYYCTENPSNKTKQTYTHTAALAGVAATKAPVAAPTNAGRESMTRGRREVRARPWVR